MSENNGTEKTSYENAVEHAKKTKKRVLLALGCIVGLLILLFLLVELIGYLTTRKPKTDKEEYQFYPVYDGNILENPSYLELDRDIVYSENADGYGYSTSITEENKESFDEYVLFLCGFLQTIIAGDEDAYNACFTKDYLDEFGAQAPFSPQMLYDMRIAFYSSEGSGANLRMTYQLDYRFHRNDGTFRRDVGSDAIRPVYVVLTKDGEGNILIDLQVIRYESKQ